MKFLIPSYKRAGAASTIDYLISMRVPYGDILVGVQTSEDYDAYNKAYRHVPLLLNDAHNCAGNRNALIKTLRVGERCVLLDDDALYLEYINDDGRTSRVSTPHDFWKFLETGFDYAGDGIWGPRYTSNFAKQYIRDHGDFSRIVKVDCGAFLGFVKDTEESIHFDEDLPFFDDCEASWRAMFEFGKRPCKLNRYVLKSTLPSPPGSKDIVNPFQGGCSKAYVEAGAERRRKVVEDAISRYPGLIAFVNPKDPFNTNTKLTNAGRKAIEALWA